MEILREIGKGDEFVYLYYFRSQVNDEAWPCKIGGTRKDPVVRVKEQQASMQEEPVIGLVMRTDNARRDERLIHAILKKEKKQLDTFGKEWFRTRPHYVEKIFETVLPELPIGAQLRYLRYEKGLTQAELAKLIGRRQALISEVETGKADAKLSTLFEIAYALELDIKLAVRTV